MVNSLSNECNYTSLKVAFVLTIENRSLFDPKNFVCELFGINCLDGAISFNVWNYFEFSEISIFVKLRQN